ncbi:Lipase 5 [Saxophila tyrrhenica]|uniref:Patatin-like phospholipase domain-containing protein n=1 Tax=Saxophila tyrrhenica TaxID=1690608 RepID=A0AAV9PH06_9PEZI|nr:Lipase 5 [Saxophila tyrrhenica]
MARPCVQTTIHVLSIDISQKLRSVATLSNWLPRDIEDIDLDDSRKLARRCRLLEDRAAARTPKERRRIDKQLYELEIASEEEAQRRKGLFDAGLVLERSQRLENAVHRHDIPELIELIRTLDSRNVGGLCNPELYDHPGVPTEPTIGRYQRAVINAFDLLTMACLGEDDEPDKHEILEALKQARVIYGNTALCCSGGGTMGMSHIGIIKALRDIDRLPRVISGSSAGAIVCAILCTRSDEELPKVLEEFCHGDLAVFVGAHEPTWLLARGIAACWRGAFFDSSNLKRVMKGHLGDMTFLEAYSKTGKILNITVSSPEVDGGANQILNYANSANVVIWSAVVASCALPLAFKAGRLYEKDPITKEVHPRADGVHHFDGSFQSDIPLRQLAKEWNCSYFIVAQNNPHVLIASQSRRRLGEGTLGKAVDRLWLAAFQQSTYILPKFGRYGKALAGILDQPYSGDITISPEWTIKGTLKVLSNPTPDFMEASRRIGEQIIEPYLPMIKNHMKIERALERAYRDVTEACHFSESQSDLRRLRLGHAAKLRRLGSTQSMPGLNARSTSRSVTKGHRRAKTETAPDVETHSSHQQSSDSSSSDRRAKFSLDLDDDSDKQANDNDSATSRTPPQDPVEDDSDMESKPWLLKSHSAPSSPRPSARTVFDSPTKSKHPIVTPFSLLMTPATDRSVSPEVRRATSPDVPVSRRDSARQPGSAVRISARSPTRTPRVIRRTQSPRDMFNVRDALPRPKRRKRNLSTGHLGVRQ